MGVSYTRISVSNLHVSVCDMRARVSYTDSCVSEFSQAAFEMLDHAVKILTALAVNSPYPHTLNPNPLPQPQIPNPHTLNPKPPALNSELYTLNPTACLSLAFCLSLAHSLSLSLSHTHTLSLSLHLFAERGRAG